MTTFLSLVLAGVSVGAVYALVALGLNVTFWTTKTLNFGHGSLMMFCAMLMVYFASQGLVLALAAVLSLLVIAAFGIFIERFTVRPALKTNNSMGWVVSTLGFGIVLQGVAAKLFGSQAVAFPSILFDSEDFVTIFGLHVSLQYLVVLGLSVFLVVVLEAFLRLTRWGQAVRAVSHDPELGRVNGMPVNAIIVGSFVLSALLGGAAGLLVSQIGGTVDPAFGFNLVLFGFVAAVVGGMGSSVGALVGGIALGVLSKLIGGYVASAAEQPVAFAILMLMLALRPNGLLAQAEATKA
ncbi:branched-chain amino acid ABC transporter permease [Bradyrhizobium sp. LHD-71]|uniref:branched-chain amino acid ABC transporter permease n=1 Tax=Bradyrhizobium sp. LHD-71 TaxID=3072141 RepID=UPI00280D1A9A|nr:branched-chain amino acid ABC transporter permease [Bradyrhizobium sp. LHD-71]MDQ8727188.1 branched-chain amino acid ABC transporter permease [Bradyrhizobium sp. LHD-71]